MLSFLDAKHSAFLQDLGRIQDRADKAQRQLSSGLRMNTISDQPDQIGVLLQSRAELASTEQTKANLSRTKTEVDAAETATANGIKAVERIRVLGSQGLTGTQSVSSRKVIAGEVESLFRDLVNIANTAIDGRYIFAGSADQNPPYAVNLTTATGATPYAGGNATRQVSDSSGVRLSVSLTAQDIYDNPTPANNAFLAVNNLRTALLANDEDAIRSAVADIGTSLDHMNEKLAYYGSVQNQVADATAAADTKSISLQAQIADTEGADLAQSILELQDASTHRQAALQAQSQEDRRTVFDFIR
jgi:flagellar hook-associated protein 3 FlgL